MARREITVRGLLKFIDACAGVLLIPDSRKEVHLRATNPKFINWEDYFPSTVKRVANRLARRGIVEKVQTDEGMMIKITDKGKQEILKYNLSELVIKKQKWDRLWRIVFFDVAEVDRHKRDLLRNYLIRLGMRQMQESVFVCAYDIGGEVRYLREFLDIPHAIKFGVLQEIENEEELREIFDV